MNENFEKIQTLLEHKRYVPLIANLNEMNEVDVAHVLDMQSPAQALLLFRMLPKNLAANVFAQLSSSKQSAFLATITDRELAPILAELAMDDIVDLVEEMPANAVKRILAQTGETERQVINQLLKYPEDSAGSLMTTEYVDLEKQMTVHDALCCIRETGLKKETVYTCYVIDQNRFLHGVISLKKLVLSQGDLLIENLCERDCIFVHTHDDQEAVAAVFKKYGFLALPVVDTERRLIGIITVDDIMDVMQQEVTEDFQIMAAMQPSDEAYLETEVFTLVKHRIGWLLLLMVSETFTGNLIAGYEDLLVTATALTTFIPMLMDTGGNSGSQSSTLIIRGLATGEIQLHDWLRVLYKELRVALAVGGILGTTSLAKTYFINGKPLALCGSVGITLMITVVAAKLTGGLLPILAKKLCLDPAIMAGPLITTIVEIGRAHV